MTPEQLKTSILYSALKGQLTEQFIGKEDAKRDYPKIKVSTAEDIPYDLPENWLWVDLKEVATNQNGYAFKPSDWLQSGTKIIRIQNLTDADVPCNYCDESIVEDKYKIKDGDVLVSWSCTIDAFLYEGEDAVLNQHIFKIIFDKISIDKRFYIYAIKSLLSTINNRRHGSTMTHITKKDFESLYFPLPPLEEQHRIVAKIEELLPYVDRYAEAYEKLEQFNAMFPEDMKKSILQYAIQGKLVEQRPEEGTAEDLYQQIQEEKQKLIKEGKIKKDKPFAEITEEEIPFDIPENWKWVRLGQIINFQGGYAFKSTAYVQSSKNQVIRLGNVKNNNLLIHEKEVFVDDELAKIASDYKLKENDILVSMTGTRRKKDYFFTLIVREDDLKERNLYLNQRVGCFRAMPGIDVEYLLAVLQNEAIKNIIFLKETGTANQGNLGSEDMKEFVYIPLPPLNEQHRIVAKLKELLPYCDRLVK